MITRFRVNFIYIIYTCVRVCVYLCTTTVNSITFGTKVVRIIFFFFHYYETFIGSLLMFGEVKGKNGGTYARGLYGRGKYTQYSSSHKFVPCSSPVFASGPSFIVIEIVFRRVKWPEKSLVRQQTFKK